MRSSICFRCACNRNDVLFHIERRKIRIHVEKFNSIFIPSDREGEKERNAN